MSALCQASGSELCSVLEGPVFSQSSPKRPGSFCSATSTFQDETLAMKIHTRACRGVPSSSLSDKPILQKGDLSPRHAQPPGPHSQFLAQVPAPNTSVFKEDSRGGAQAPQLQLPNLTLKGR